MALLDASIEAVVTDVIDEIRQSVASPSRLRRVRCSHCLMPVGSSSPSCWSCGLDPTGPADADGPPVPAATGTTPLPPPWHSALLGAAASVLVLVALLGTVLMLEPQEDGRGVRGIHARLSGRSWARAEVGGATADFPSRPVRRTAELGTQTGTALVATVPGLQVELWAMTPPDRPSPVALIEAYGASTGRQIRDASAVTVDGAPALDAGLEGARGPSRVRAVLTRASAYLLVVEGPTAAFDRFTASFAAPG